ncbi:MAG: 30S ribosomal protein S16 [Candidatus Omnitrophica bacterium]|nr:30S ribosomal protein S16 [Candidatus Omnitrophota bacterium]MCM8808754.1 30S ribosomal protein S16 [Candidatus Omnitrophota bacterium]
MATKIRLVRKGKRNRPFFRVIAVSDEKDGRGDVLEVLGYYDPLPDPAIFQVKEDRVKYWLSVGAKPSPTVESFLKKKGII